VADLLVQNGADLETKDNEGFTPFLLASYYGDTVLMELLIKKGADIYSTNNAGNNALTLSIMAGQKNITLFLFKSGNKWASQVNRAVDPYRVASKYRRNEMFEILRNNNIPGQIKHEIDQIALTVSSRFFLNDYFTGFSLSFKEPYLNAGFITGLDTKLWYTRVLIKDSEHLFYQYRDKGSVAYAGLFKDFALTDNPYSFNYAISTSLMAGYTFGNMMKGTLIAAENKFKVIPAVSVKISKKYLTFNMGLEYLKTSFYHNGPVWIRVGCSYNYFFDNIRTQIKPIKWY
jgi:hypothetical protein